MGRPRDRNRPIGGWESERPDSNRRPPDAMQERRDGERESGRHGGLGAQPTRSVATSLTVLRRFERLPASVPYPDAGSLSAVSNPPPQSADAAAGRR